jgi:beta-N-acetylhexosaminidase
MLLFKRILDDGVRSRAFTGAVLVVGDANGIIFENYAGARVGANTIFDLASLTKVVVTTTLALALVDEGSLALDERVEGYTIRQLLTHSAGLAAEADLEIVGGPRSASATARSLINRPPLQYEPGSKTVYSDVGFIILGRIIENITGTSLDALAKERIFEPLGMNDTDFNPDESLYPRIAPTAPGVQGKVHDKIAAAMGGVAGHAGLFSTGRDLAIFCRNILRSGKRFDAVAGSTRALGWDTPSPENSSSGQYFSKGSFGHTGFTGTSMWVDPNRQVYVIFLTNRVYYGADDLQIREIRPRLHDAVMSSLVGAGPTLNK